MIAKLKVSNKLYFSFLELVLFGSANFLIESGNNLFLRMLNFKNKRQLFCINKHTDDLNQN